MTALLRYVYLKSLRDSSLIAFVVLPMMFPVAALSGATLAKGRLHYPLYMAEHFSPVQNATLCAQIALAVCVLFSVIPAFWTLRPEIATRSVASFLLAARPLTVALSVILFAFAIGMAGWIGAIAMIRILTAALPLHLAFMTLKFAAGALLMSAFGTLIVTISPQPGMMVGSYFLCLFVVPWAETAKSTVQLVAALAVAIVCSLLSAFLLERRCAT